MTKLEKWNTSRNNCYILKVCPPWFEFWFISILFQLQVRLIQEDWPQLTFMLGKYITIMVIVILTIVVATKFWWSWGSWLVVQRVDKEQIPLSGKGLDENGLDMMMMVVRRRKDIKQIFTHVVRFFPYVNDHCWCWEPRMITSDLWWPEEQQKASSFTTLEPLRLMSLEET